MLGVQQSMTARSRYWDDDESHIVSAKWSQLFYEVNIGTNLTASSWESTADFLYFSLGIGFPTQKNAWRKFLPEQQAPSDKGDAALLGSMTTDNLYAGKLGVGLIHFFNCYIGCYVQAGWAFIADFSSVADLDTSGVELGDNEEKSTYIYNTAPVEIGACLNLGHFHFQVGATYLWKEVPLLTVGLGFTF